MRNLDAAGGGLDLITGRRVHVALDIGGVVARAVVLAAVALTFPAVAAAIAVTVAAAVPAVAAAITVSASAVAAAITATVSAAITATVSAAITAAVSTTIAAAAPAFGIGLGHNDTIEGETERRDNKRQRSQRSQDQPAAPAL
ncbi:membrane hypothetical protein [Mesorhizobium sp. ORS 3359]|nr:membrane hypothetical protein [Mesorhizobium sp. ORS 3359]